MNFTKSVISHAEKNLLKAVKNGKFFTTRLLARSSGINLNAQDEDGNTIAHLAVLSKDMGLVSFVASLEGIDLSIRNKAEKRAVDLAEDSHMKTMLIPSPRQVAKPTDCFVPEVKFRTRVSEGSWMPSPLG